MSKGRLEPPQQLRSMMEEKKQTSALEVKAVKKNLRYDRDKDREMVKGIFHFYEVPGSVMRFVYKKYKQDKPKRYALKDGEVCNIPLGVAKHLNKDCWYPVHENAVDTDGKNIYKVGAKKRRCGFQSLEFVDPADFDSVDSNIVMAQKV